MFQQLHNLSVFFCSESSSEDEDDRRPAKPLTFANKKEAMDAFKQLLKEKVCLSLLYLSLISVSYLCLLYMSFIYVFYICLLF